jgi:hypothetical protein
MSQELEQMNKWFNQVKGIKPKNTTYSSMMDTSPKTSYNNSNSKSLTELLILNRKQHKSL